MIPDKIYDILKWISRVVLPAIGTLYFALAGIWGFPYAEQILGTITALVTFLGVVLGISSAKYEPEADGVLVEQLTETGEGTGSFYVELASDPASLTGKKIVTFKLV